MILAGIKLMSLFKTIFLKHKNM